MNNQNSPCEMTSNKILVLVAIVMATAVLFYAVNTVFAMTPEMFVERMEEEIGIENGSNQTQSVVTSYIENIKKAIGDVD